MSTSFVTKIGVEFYVFDCPTCSMLVAIESGFDDRRREDGAWFHCPRGHRIRYTEPEIKRLKRERDAAKREADSWRKTATHEKCKRTQTEYSLRATKGVVTRIKNRVGKGICPVCNRSFQNLKAHMEGKHPTWTEAEG